MASTRVITSSKFRPEIASKACHNVANRMVSTETRKKEGDISSVFMSLNGTAQQPLPERYASLKRRLIFGNEDAVRKSWHRLLKQLETEIKEIKELGPAIVPDIDFSDIQKAPESYKQNLKKTGVTVIRGVVPKNEALKYKADIREYIKNNPHTKAFPADDPQVFELYWSSSQLMVRANENLLKAQRFLMEFWHSKDPNAPVSPSHPVSYADRLRIRNPGDARFALGPHVDGGSVERWEEEGYGKGHVYQDIWEGNWEKHDPWESGCRLTAVSDLYQGPGACSMFRMFQGWLSMSTTGPNQGTLLVNPLFSRATAYYLLRPFFTPKSTSPETFLDVDNWELESSPSSELQGAYPSQSLELNDLIHPHLKLGDSMVHVPKVNPGDYVAWHCDTIHAVDKNHNGTGDSTVLYIPATPLTEQNAEYLARQRTNFVQGIPAPDFPGGIGEENHVGRGTPEMLASYPLPAQRVMGLASWDTHASGLSKTQVHLLEKSNKILGFS